MGSYTPRLNLYKPAIGETDWGDEVNQNFDKMDKVVHILRSFGSTGANVNDLTFSKKAICRPFMLANTKFTLHYDDFIIERFHYITVDEGSPSVSRSYQDGVYHVEYSSSGAQYYRLLSSWRYPIFGAIMKISDISDAHVQCGLMTPDNSNRIVCIYSAISNTFRIDERIDNSNYTRASKDLSTPPKYMLFAVVGKWAMIFHSDDGKNWIFGAKATLEQDLRDDATKNNLYPYFGGGSSAGYYEVDEIRFFIPLGVGYRDIKMVTDIFGNPIHINGKYYYTINTRIGGESGVPCAISVVYSFDPTTFEFNPESVIFSKRDGNVINDYVTHLAYDPRNGKWLVLQSTWGTFDSTNSVDIYIGTTTNNILRGIHIVELSKLNLPISTSSYDPTLIFTNDKYYLACVVTDSKTAPWSYGVYLFESTDLNTWSQVASYTPSGCSEGPIFCKIGGTWYIVASKGTNTIVVLSFPDLTEVRTISVDTGHHQPWGGIFPMLKDGKTRYYLLTPDEETAIVGGVDLGNTAGSIHIYESDQAYDGYEYDITSM